MWSKLSLMLYMLLVELVACALVIVPVYAFQVSSSTTGYVRVASQAAVSSMVAAQRMATLSSVASLVSTSTAGSIGVRLVAGAVGWPALGIVAGMTLAMLYYDATQTAAIKAAAATPGAWSVEGYTGPLLGVVTAAGFTYVIYGDGRVNNGCPAAASLALFNLGFYSGQYIQNTLPLTAGPYCAMGKPTTAAGPFPTQGEATPATAPQVAAYLSTLPASDPNSVESNTVPVGAQAT